MKKLRFSYLLFCCTNCLAQEDLFTKPADPLNLLTTVDTSRAATAVIPVTGGILTTTGADGTLYTLTVPKDALLVEQSITMTPILTVDGRSLGSSNGPSTGVKLEPDGLRLYQPARLVIEPLPGSPAASAPRYPAGFHGEGASFHGEPLILSESKLTLNLMHFSGAVDLGYMGDGIRIQFHTPEEFEDRVNQYLSDLVRKEQEAAMNNQPGDPDFFDKSRNVMEQYYDRVIGPSMTAAEKDCNLAQTVVPKGLAFARQATLLSEAEGNSPLIQKSQAVLASWQKAAENCWAMEKLKCRFEGDRARLTKILSAVRQLQLSGDSETTASVSDVPICQGWFCETSGTSSDYLGGNRILSAIAGFQPQLANQNTYLVTEGSVTWKITGSVAGCAITSGGGPITTPMTSADGAITFVNGPPKTYQASGSTYSVNTLGLTCPDGSVLSLPFSGGGLWIQTPPGKPFAVDADGKSLSGSFSDGYVSLAWKCTASEARAPQ